MKCNVRNRISDAEADSLTKRNIKTNSAYLNYVSRMMYVSIHDNAGFGKDRLKKLNEITYESIQWYIQRYSPEDVEQKDEDYAVDSYYGMRRHLQMWGFEPEEELWQDVPFGDGDFPSPPTSARERERRKMYLHYANTLSFYVREMLCGIVGTLHEEFGLGTVRLRRILEPVKERYLRTMRFYLIQDKAYVLAEMRQILSAFNEMGAFSKEYTL